MLNCKKTAGLLAEFIEHNLAPALQQEVAKHLEGCALCAQLQSTYEKTRKLCRAALQARCPVELGARLLAYLKREIGKE